MLDVFLRTSTIALNLVMLMTAASLLAGCNLLSVDLQRAPEAVPIAATAPASPAPDADDNARPAGWTEASHSNDVDPNYDVVFPIDAVNTLTITIAPEDWAAMQADMEELFGADRDQVQALAAMTDEERAAYLQQQIADAAAGGANPLAAEFTLRSPIWVPATIGFQDQEWTHVGVRYKGASSLSPWKEGEMKLPFKFDFDEFEDDYPAIKNQRFFGFKELSLANNYEDPAGMRDTLTYEVLAEAGLPSVRTAPVEIVLDYGEGPLRLGLYTMIEVVDETGIPRYFGSDDGNIYEANGLGASLAKEAAAQLEASFEKKNNEDEADWSDIRALYDVLHADVRTSDPATWRADLEAIFDVDSFLEWLGIAAVVGHGDTYGLAGHNFYLYNDPATGKLTWVSWDHNVTFRQELKPFLVLDKSIVGDHWPLIRFLLDDPVYWACYVELLAENAATVLASDALLARIRAHADLIAPVATQYMRQEEYDAAVQELIDFVEMRAQDVEQFLQEHETAAAPAVTDKAATDDSRPTGWTEASHSNDVDPNYDVVFPVDAVNTLTITIAPEDWAAMQADLEDIYAPQLSIRQGILAAGPDLTKEERDKLMLELFAAEAAKRAAAAPPIAATAPVTATDGVAVPAPKEQMNFARSPIWVPATVAFQGQEWTHVGVRHKGATSLSMPWLLGEMKLPFKFDFDQFEDEFPEIKNQRFFGFKQLSLANNHEDPAAMRDTLVYELLDAAGLPSLRTAPYEIVLDYGEGPVRLGLYTLIEVVDDTGVPSHFGSDDGNIYEGEGWGASLAVQDAHLLEDSFQKKNNEDEADWSDLWALYEVLHAEQRTTDPAAWRADLEAVFDVDGFLEWLGIAAVVGHADTYGAAYHNFYLYNDPATGKLTWFSWDHNMTFLETMRPLLSLDKADITDAWPLIRFLLDDPVYRERYAALLAENFATVLAPDALVEKIRAHASLLAPVATKDMSQAEYDAAVQALIDFVEVRALDVEAFLAGQE